MKKCPIFKCCKYTIPFVLNQKSLVRRVGGKQGNIKLAPPPPHPFHPFNFIPSAPTITSSPAFPSILSIPSKQPVHLSGILPLSYRTPISSKTCRWGKPLQCWESNDSLHSLVISAPQKSESSYEQELRTSVRSSVTQPRSSESEQCSNSPRVCVTAKLTIFFVSDVIDRTATKSLWLQLLVRGACYIIPI